MLDELISNLVIGIHTFAQEYERFFLEEQFELFSLSRLKEDIDGADGAVVRIFFSCGTKTGICGHFFFLSFVDWLERLVGGDEAGAGCNVDGVWLR